MHQPQFNATIYRSTGIATKQIALEDGKLVSKSRPELSSGLASIKTLTLSELPKLLNNFDSDNALGCGIPLLDVNEFRLMTRKKLLTLCNDSQLQDQTGTMLARLAEHFHHPVDSSLMVFDYDPSASCPLNLATPAEFASWLASICPEFKNAAYVAKYSTSSGITFNNQVIKPNSGYHLYFVVKLGNKSQQEIYTHIIQQAWLKGFGYIEVSKSGAALTRVPLDASVAQTNRIMYEAPAVLLTEGLAQNNKAWFVDGEPLVDVSQIAKPNSNSRTRDIQNQVDHCIMLAKQDPVVMQKINDIKSSKVQSFMSDFGYSKKQAEAAVEFQTQGILNQNLVLFFDDGRQATVFDTLINPMSYHGCTLADPLEPEKGINKAQFYANDLGASPVIHTFVRGEGNYLLSDSWVVQQQVIEADTKKSFDGINNCSISECGFTEKDRWFDAPLPNNRLIALVGDQGTGKTEQIAKWQSAGVLGSILSIAPRIALVIATAARLKISAYSDEDVLGCKAMLAAGLSTTLDSIPKFEHYAVDTLFLDEFEQSIQHLKAETLKNRRRVIKTLRLLCQRAKRIIIADADLSASTIQMLQKWHVLPENDLHVFLNHYKACEGGEIHLADSELQVQAAVLEAVKRNEGCYIASNKKGSLHILVRMLLQEITPKDKNYSYKNGDFLIELVTGQRIVIITKDNSSSEEVGFFTQNINTELRSTDILLTSPSIGTGVSINVINGLPILKNRFVILSALVGTTSADAVQHLERVRGGEHCKTIIYAQDAKLNLCCDTSLVVLQDLQSKAIELYRANNLDINTDTIYYRDTEINELDHLYAELYSSITVQTNVDRNNYNRNIKNRLVDKGYTIKTSTVVISNDIKNTVKAAKNSQSTYLHNILLDADLLSDSDLQGLLNLKQQRSIEDTAAMNKTLFSNLLGITEVKETNIILNDNKANRLKAIEDSMKLAISNRRAVQLEISALARQSGTITDINCLYARKCLAIKLLSFVGVRQLESGELIAEEQVFSGRDITAIYNKICDEDLDPKRPGYSRVKALLNVNVSHAHRSGNSSHSAVEAGKVMANVYRKIGIFFKRTTARDPEKKSVVMHVKMVDTEWLDYINSHMLHAIKHSKHDWFKPQLEVGSELLQYRWDKIINSETKTPSKLYDILDVLESNYKSVIDELLDSSIFELKYPDLVLMN